jgi:hypothetical protein
VGHRAEPCPAVERLIAGGADLNARSAVMKYAKPRTPITVLPRAAGRR